MIQNALLDHHAPNIKTKYKSESKIKNGSEIRNGSEIVNLKLKMVANPPFFYIYILKADTALASLLWKRNGWLYKLKVDELDSRFTFYPVAKYVPTRE